MDSFPCMHFGRADLGEGKQALALARPPIGSTLITLAPISRSTVPANGAAKNVPSSSSMTSASAVSPGDRTCRRPRRSPRRARSTGDDAARRRRHRAPAHLVRARPACRTSGRSGPAGGPCRARGRRSRPPRRGAASAGGRAARSRAAWSRPRRRDCSSKTRFHSLSGLDCTTSIEPIPVLPGLGCVGRPHCVLPLRIFDHPREAELLEHRHVEVQLHLGELQPPPVLGQRDQQHEDHR